VRLLEKGDRNTSFFHAVCSKRRTSSRIGHLKKDDGGCVEEEKRRFIANYFRNLFRSNGATDSHELTDILQCRVTEGMNESLLKEFSSEEVKVAIDAIGDMKVPGLDGMPALFYKQFWEIVGDKVMQAVLNVLNGGQFPEEWNETTIILISKVKKP
jgi:hypothetical protein